MSRILTVISRPLRLPMPLAAVVAASVGLFAAVVPLPAAAESAVLKSRIYVEAETVRASDVFHIAQADEDPVLFAAPAPGERLVVSPVVLERKAAAAGIDWNGGANVRRVTIERASHSVGAIEIAKLVAEEFSVRGILPLAEVQLANRNAEMHLPLDAPRDVLVESLDYDARTGRFEAAVVPAALPGAAPLAVIGRAYEMVEVPVLAVPLDRGDTIGETDVTLKPMRADRLQTDAVRSVHDIVGMSPRRMLRADTPLRDSDLRRPVIVARNANVRLVYRIPGMQLSAMGMALEDASAGDTIRIRNTDTNITIEARVREDGTAVVTPRPRVLQAF